MDEYQIGTIPINGKTRGHQDWLRSKGYEVEETDKQYRVKVTRFLTGEIELRGDVDKSVEEQREYARKFLMKMVEEKQAFTYKTKVILPGEDRYHQSKWLCMKLGTTSALVMQPIGPLTMSIGSPKRTDNNPYDF